MLRFNGDGTLLVGGGGEGDTLVWNLTSNATTRIPHGGTGGVRTWQDKRGRLAWRGGPTIDVEASGARVATAGPDETAAVWDASSGRELFRLQHETTVTALTFVPRTEKLATVSEGGVVRCGISGPVGSYCGLSTAAPHIGLLHRIRDAIRKHQRQGSAGLGRWYGRTAGDARAHRAGLCSSLQRGRHKGRDLWQRHRDDDLGLALGKCPQANPR